ncbi:hypothetical protein chiPu_0030291, partial [Chiloscyllium punctatum]|nr:hypothetical protein [Chiloscyllium punctatum]
VWMHHLYPELELGPGTQELGQSPGKGSGWRKGSGDGILAEGTSEVQSAVVGATSAGFLRGIAASGTALPFAE